MTDLTPFLQAIIGLATFFITIVIVPYLRNKGKNEELVDIVEQSVKAAQQLAKSLNWSGKDKKEYVVSLLESKGYKVDLDDVTDAVNVLIEATVYEIKN